MRSLVALPCRVSLLALLALLQGCASCQIPFLGGGGPGEGIDAGIEIIEDGIDDADAGSVDAGADAGTPDGGAPVDGGVLPDAGLVPYDGGPPEDGVRCGETLTPCAVDDGCCVMITSFTPEIVLTGTCAAPTDAGIPCGNEFLPGFLFTCDDGAVDCPVEGACCFHALIDQTQLVFELESFCLDAPTCTTNGDSIVCTNDGDCPDEGVCCSATVEGFTLPVDFGVCRASCDEAPF
jgi:hypothetical protein